MRLILVVGTAVTFVLLGCSAGGSGSTNLVEPVQAQTAYSNASIAGTYSMVVTSANYQNYIGSLTTDGKGNITSGTLTNTNLSKSATSVCNLSVTGTYSLQSDASGTANLSFAVAPSSNAAGCSTSGIGSFTTYAIEAGSSGASIFLQPYNSDLSMIGSKQ